ncbi:hypothetical protein AB7C87_17010 [Natrarchaeobius sp. A-rgal3]|uniref:hypothetical protein n=1 Tax=Natrarchaeobius versutus TaxID=1679078 RepID=UPI00350F5A73
MILNLIRTTLQIDGYLNELRYPKTRMAIYLLTSVIAGVWLSTSTRATELPILTLTAILFGFTINAVVMLGNSSEHYLASETNHSEQLRKYYQKSLHISIHTLGIGIITIILTGVFQLFPRFSLYTIDVQLIGHTLNFELLGAAVYSFTVYYLIVFSVVIASVAELVKIRV